MTDSQPDSAATAGSLRPRLVNPVALAELTASLAPGKPGASITLADPASASLATAVTGASLNSRTIRPGDLYLALPGARTHGAHFTAQAIGDGAAAVLTDQAGAELIKAQEQAGQLSSPLPPLLIAEDPRGIAGYVAARIYQRNPLSLVGITGTNGKTTVSYLVRSLFAALGRDSGLIGTVETLIGQNRVPSALTTPESPDLHALLARMSEESLQAAVMEVSSHALTFGRVDGVLFDTAGFTNLSQDHLDLHGDMDSYLEAKAALFTPERSRRGVVVIDQSWGRKLAAHAQIPVLTLWTGQGSGEAEEADPVASARSTEQADWRVIEADREGLGWRIKLRGQAGELSFRTSLPGRFNIANAALAVLLVHNSGVSLDALQKVLDAREPFRIDVPGRMQLIGAAPIAIVDFAHNPEGLRQALEAVRPEQGRLITVFGATGERDQGKRPIMGALAVRGSDIVIVTDDDPHDEPAAQIRDQVMAGAQAERERMRAEGHEPERLEDVAPRAAAIDRAVALARPQDTILIAGRGHEVWQEVSGTNLPLDDREELRVALTRHGFDALGQSGLES
ncbi:UDP-N-acetylmuramoyl-L-alanyl-D-glutamate--2,6-diaminopimelate ligase [Acaricomes phytoseiuli]|uniref:UDP-N-acetylmuramoyl-L-alanyl-D-glutamate--2, 6-diaminopimelate ligase n=1 Tax=Acaricomes phytoseiuli TaxID=291968 RepID=UPI00036C36FD